ncbi:ABC transporter substrate-binding protein (plasmid) [Tistrella mobilis]|jgi:peptide/nickel transport system substrate-binding protein|uniref:ABC transporter substrate-binding protein n=1 Tax=Tistrella mobilis TaxID=171437 RepID=UPI00355646CA
MKINAGLTGVLAGLGLLGSLGAPLQVSAQETTTLKVVGHAALKMLDPITTTAYITRNHGYFIYDTLFAVDANFEPQPQMVKEWSVSDDGMTYTFTLRDGLAFHDGAPVTAEDAVASVRRWAARDLTGIRMMKAAKEFVAVDDRTFRLVLAEPFGAVIDALAKPSSLVPFIMPKRIAETSPTEQIRDYIGSGPFRFVVDEFQPGVKAVYVRNEAYVPRDEPASGLAGGKIARVDRVEYLSFPDQQTAANALTKGEVDILENIYADTVGQLTGVDGVEVQKLKSSNVPTMRLNWLQPPFDNVKVRQAVLHAVSQTDFMDAQIGDPDLYTICGAMFGCGTPLATEDGAIQTAVTPDYAGAKALLKEAGYKGEKVVVLHPTDLASLSAVAPMTVQALRQIGMTVEMQSMDWATFLQRRNKKDPVDQGGWSVAYGSWNMLDLTSPLSNLNLDTRGPDGYVGWSADETLAGLKDAFAAASDPAEKKRLAAAIQARAYELVFYIPLGTYANVSAHRTGVDPLIDSPVQVYWGIAKH